VASRSEIVVLAIDIGSSSTRCAFFNSGGAMLRRTLTSAEYSIQYAADGAAELAPNDLYRAVKRCLAATLHKKRPGQIKAVAVSSFWHALLGLNRRWQPVTPVYTWADSRSRKAAADLRREFSERRIHARTGCKLHSSYWPAKLRWLGSESPALARQVALWVSPVDWILHEIFGTVHTSSSIASGTGLYNLRRKQWDGELCRGLGLTIENLPAIRAAPVMVSSTRERLSLVSLTVLGDGAASNLGSGAIESGAVAINVGTSAAVRVVVPSRRRKAAHNLFHYVLDEKHSIVGGALSNAGNLREWALRELRTADKRQDKSEMVSRKSAALDSLVALPSWIDERASTWPEDAGGVIYGLNQATTANEITRVLATAVYYRLARILDWLRTSGFSTRRIIVSGGILQSVGALRLLADALGRDIEISRVQEASLRGAAIFALKKLGFEVPNIRRGRSVEHNPELAREHRKRRARQESLEDLIREWPSSDPRRKPPSA
jgi:gluconokinase